MQNERYEDEESLVASRIPIVVGAMKQSELPQMEQGSFLNAKTTAGVATLLGTLEANGITAVRDRYGARRETWRPFGLGSGTIEDIVTNFFNQPKREFPLNPDFSYTEHFFHSNPVTCMTSWARLQDEKWCFLIIDGVSLYHPHIQDTLLSALGVLNPERATIAVLSPFDTTRDTIHGMLLSHIETTLKALMTRYKIRLDPKAEILSGDSYSFLRWLSARMQDTKNEIERDFGPMNPTRRSTMRHLVPTPQSTYGTSARKTYP